MKQIHLTQGQAAIVDDEDFEKVNSFKWYAAWKEHTKSYYAVRQVCTKGVVKNIYLHRLIMDTPDHLVCDFVNGDTLDNRKQNLRNCTKEEDHRNRRVNRESKTGVKGVSWLPKFQRYEVSIKLNGKRVFNKRFKTLEEAKEAYDEASKKYHGEYGR